MLIRLHQLLEQAPLQRLQALIQRGAFVDGRGSAGRRLHDVKNNLELEAAPEIGKEIADVIFGALFRNRDFQAFARPQRLLSPIVNRFDAGMAYGRHVDGPIMGRQNPIRTDLSMTLFLSDPQSYEGGELVLEAPLGEERVKLPAGDAVVYATTVHHCVAPVTQGTRLAAVTWVQSYVRDPAQRQMLFDLNVAKDLVSEASPKSEQAELLVKTYNNLYRMWAAS